MENSMAKNTLQSSNVQQNNAILLVKVKTQYTKEAVRKFSLFCYKNIIKAVVALMGLTTLVLLLSIATSRYQRVDITREISFLIICAIFLLAIFIVVYSDKGKTNRTDKYYSNGLIATFYNTHFEITYAGTQANGAINASYQVISKIHETKDMFYLFISSNQAYLISKNAVLEGNVAALQDFFKKIGVKYKVSK